MTPNDATPPATTAFVFTGGGSLGAAQVGMLKALVAHGILPDLVVGASVGALNAAHFAASPDGSGLPALEALWRSLRREDVFPITPWRGLMALLLRREHMASAYPLRALIKRTIAFRDLADARIPCHVVAADLFDGATVRLSSGPAVEALLATAAIPGLFPPVSLGGRVLVDGMMSRETPLRVAAGLGASRLVVLSAGFPCALDKPPRSAAATAVHAISLLSARALAMDVDDIARTVLVVVPPPLCPLETSAFDFSQTGQLIDRAQAATDQWIAAGGLESRMRPESLAPHHHVMVQAGAGRLAATRGPSGSAPARRRRSPG